MTLPYHVWYRLLRRRMQLAAEVAATQPSYRAWVGVYPLRDCDECFNVRYFEVRRDWVEAGYDIHEEELANKETIRVESAEELEHVLARWLNDFEKLVQPGFCDYPI